MLLILYNLNIFNSILINVKIIKNHLIQLFYYIMVILIPYFYKQLNRKILIIQFINTYIHLFIVPILNFILYLLFYEQLRDTNNINYMITYKMFHIIIYLISNLQIFKYFIHFFIYRYQKRYNFLFYINIQQSYIINFILRNFQHFLFLHNIFQDF